MVYDLGILNGRIYSGGQWFRGNLYVKDGIISAVCKGKLRCKSEYDASGNWVLPGFIDPHVHFQLDLGKYVSVEDFEIGSKCAAYGGFTTIIDFLEPVKDKDSLNKAFGKRLKEADKSCIDYSFHATICGLDGDVEEFLDNARVLGIPTIKMFTTYSSSDRKTDDNLVFKLIELSEQKNILPLIHAENDDFILENNIEVKNHEESRPTISELSEVMKVANFVEYTGGRAYIVHVSSGATLHNLINKYRDIVNTQLLIESCPQYFYFTKDMYLKGDRNLYTLSPPLRSEDERIALIDTFDYINTIGTDHCSFMRSDKEGEFTSDIPMGIGGIETSFPAMYTLFGERVIEKFTEVPAKIHGLYPSKGTLHLGTQADIVIFDPDKRSSIKTHYRCDYDLYEDVVMKGEVKSTLLRGRFIVKDGEFLGGKGSYIGRELIR